MSFSNASIEALAPCGVGHGPPIRAEACTRLPFRLFSEVVHRRVDNRCACASR